MLYHKDWCSLEYLKDKITINLNVTDTDVTNVAGLPLDTVFNNAVANAVEVVGNNPAICLSGGIDSQVTLDIWKRSGVPFTAVTFDFGNGFNSEELADALAYAEFLEVPVKVIRLDVMRFLSHELPEFSLRFKMMSPQFCVHARFIEQIKSLGYTGAVMGGNGPILEESNITFQLSTAQLLDIEKYSNISKFPVLPSFLSFDRDLCLSLAIRTPIINKIKSTDHRTYLYDANLKSMKSSDIFVSVDRYSTKVESYTNLGLRTKPQTIKKTGFEQIKEYYNALNGTYAAFDRDFRLPLLNKIPESTVETVIDDKVKFAVLTLADRLTP